MYLTRVQKNKIYEAITSVGLDPAQFDLEVADDKIVITHDAGSVLMFLPRPRGLVSLVRGQLLEVRSHVFDGTDQLYRTAANIDGITYVVVRWAHEVKDATEVPDYWEELKRSRELIADVNNDESGNTPFTQDEQRQIADQLQEVKKQLKEQFELTSEQIADIGERFDEAAEASERLGRKDWLLLFGGTILNLIITDTLTPGVAGHIFTTVVHGLIHLFTGAGGPPQIIG